MTKEQLVHSLRYCSAVGMCDDCALSTIQKEFGAQFCDDRLKSDAADLIEAQAVEIEKLKARVPRWIPVTERLPEQDVPVLARFEDGLISRQSPDIVLWNGRGWMHLHLHRNVCGIRHWMPLPGVDV